MKCDICDFESEQREVLAGHRSGHVRRGDISKQTKRKDGERSCPICGMICKSGRSLGGHLRSHDKTFDQLRSEGTKKVRLLAERGHQCEVCKNEEWMSEEIPLQLDHINGNPQDNARNNLRLVCPNCHAQTDTYCGRNIGRPRCKRRDEKQTRSYRSKERIEKQNI